MELCENFLGFGRQSQPETLVDKVVDFVNDHEDAIVFGAGIIAGITVYKAYPYIKGAAIAVNDFLFDNKGERVLPNK